MAPTSPALTVRRPVGVEIGTKIGVGLGVGFVLWPAACGLVARLGLAIGLAPLPSQPPAFGSGGYWIAMLLLAPLLEEWLYRGWMLSALRRHLGPVASVAISSAFFALPHLHPWGVLGTFVVGLVLGTLRVTGGGIALCIGLHAGLNLAILLTGAPPTAHPLSEGTSLLLPVGALVLRRVRSPALRNRLLSAAVALVVVGSARSAIPDVAERAVFLYVVVAALGYAHLIGATGILHRGIGRDRLRWLAGSTLALLGLVLHTELLRGFPGWLPALLALATWHSIENDRAMAHAYAAGGARLSPVAGSPGQAIAMFAAAAVGLAALRLEHGPHFADLYALTTLHHLISWGVFVWDRRPRRERGPVIALHVASAGVCVGLVLAGGGASAALRTAVLSPAVYLYWSTLHTLHTARRRRG